MRPSPRQTFDDFYGQVGVDRAGAVTDEQAEVVGLTWFAALHHQAGTGTGTDTQQVMVHGCTCEQGRHGSLLATEGTVRKDQDLRPFVHSRRSLLAQLIDRLGKRLVPARDLKYGREGTAAETAPAVQSLQLRNGRR